MHEALVSTSWYRFSVFSATFHSSTTLWKTIFFFQDFCLLKLVLLTYLVSSLQGKVSISSYLAGTHISVVYSFDTERFILILFNQPSFSFRWLQKFPGWTQASWCHFSATSSARKSCLFWDRFWPAHGKNFCKPNTFFQYIISLRFIAPDGWLFTLFMGCNCRSVRNTRMQINIMEYSRLMDLKFRYVSHNSF